MSGGGNQGQLTRIELAGRETETLQQVLERINARPELAASLTTAQQATERARIGLLAQYVDSRDYPTTIDPTGVLDSTAGIQAAIAVADAAGVPFRLSWGYYNVSGITLGLYTKLHGDGAVIRPIAGKSTGALITIPSGLGLQTTAFVEIRGIRVAGGMTRGDGNTLIGIYTGNHAAVRMKDVQVEKCWTGFQFLGSQFGVYENCKAWACDLGVYVKSIPIQGGGNSNTFGDLQAVGCIVGVLMNNASIYPMHSTYFRNFTAIDNQICGIAFISATLGLMDGIVLDGGAPESTDYAGTGPATYTYDGVTLEKSSVYMSKAGIEARNYQIAEAQVAVAYCLRNGSTLDGNFLAGYGNTAGRLFDCDATSRVSLRGPVKLSNQTAQISKFDGDYSEGLALFVLPPTKFLSELSNFFTNPARGDIGTGHNTTGSGGVDASNQPYYQDAFTTVVVPGGNNAYDRRFTVPSTTAGLIAVAMDIVADRDVTLVAGYLNNHRSLGFDLKAGVPQRIVHVTSALSATFAFFCIFVANAGAAVTLQYSNFMGYTAAADTPQARGDVNQIIAGAFNPKKSRLQATGVAPVSTPNWFDEFSRDTSSGKVYASKGITSSADWAVLN